jgi:4'-phosphopantetheinyl transferase
MIKNPEIILSPDEVEKAGRYHSKTASLQYINERRLLREVLSKYIPYDPSEIIFEYSMKGKSRIKGEFFDGVQFNLSHSGDMVAIAVSRGRRVGIDVEKIRDDIPEAELARRFFSSTEAAAFSHFHGFRKSELFLKMWTRKEALLKATGEGIGGLGNCFDISNECYISRNGTSWQVHDLEVPIGYISALAIEGEEGFIKKRVVSS